MDFTPMVPRQAQIVDGYGPGQFRINGQLHDGPRVVLPDSHVAWSVTSVSGITADSLASVAEAQPAVEILLIGTGDKMAMPPRGLKLAMKDRHGISVEVMDTGAACRTYNVLMSEGRRVALAALPVGLG